VATKFLGVQCYNSSKYTTDFNSNLTSMFQGQSGRDLLIFFEKGAWPGSRDPL